jgi:transcriptional regulator with XRE-family HTH domain
MPQPTPPKTTKTRRLRPVLRQARKRCGLTQAGFAEFLGISGQFYSKLETAAVPGGPITWMALEFQLGIPMAELRKVVSCEISTS